MKKLLLVLCVCFMGLSLFAQSDRPYVIIHKSNGGWWAWLNLYNDVLYTPSEDDSTPARLDCIGAGFSFCRVPNQNPFTLNNNCRVANNVDISPLVVDAINEIIEKSEENGQRGSLRGTACKKIAVRNSNRNGTDTYFVQGKWNYNAYGEGELVIYISQSNILNTRM